MEQALPALLEKIWGAGKRAVVLTDSASSAELLAEKLWTYKQLSFLPHGTRKDGAPEAQPIWITETLENPNGAGILVRTPGARDDDFLTIPTLGFERCLDLFEGHHEQALTAAKTRWSAAETAGWACTAWHQNEAGAWVQGTL